MEKPGPNINKAEENENRRVPYSFLLPWASPTILPYPRQKQGEIIWVYAPR